MMQSIKFINFDEWEKRNNSENINNHNKKVKKSIEVLTSDKNKRIDISNLEEVLESNFEEIVMNMKVNCYNSVLSIGESFFRDSTNYSERFPDLSKFKDYINEEFSKMTDNIINKKEKFIDGIFFSLSFLYILFLL